MGGVEILIFPASLAYASKRQANLERTRGGFREEERSRLE
jgi:hypothetical protein